MQPSRETFDDMMSNIGSIPSYDGGDTGFLNGYFPNWFLEGPDSRLPFGYNALRTMHWMTRCDCFDSALLDSYLPSKLHTDEEQRSAQEDARVLGRGGAAALRPLLLLPQALAAGSSWRAGARVVGRLRHLPARPPPHQPRLGRCPLPVPAASKCGSGCSAGRRRRGDELRAGRAPGGWSGRQGRSCSMPHGGRQRRRMPVGWAWHGWHGSEGQGARQMPSRA